MNNQKKKLMEITTSLYGPNNEELRPIPVDPLGSYTGRAADPYEKPIQDADDL